jgi:hypothetical protein
MRRTIVALRRARTLLPVFGLVGVLTGALACDDDDDFTGPIGIVETFVDPAFNFATLTTFAMPDTVIHLIAPTGTPIDPTRAFDATILAQVRQNLLARGYTQVLNPQTVMPSFVVLVTTTATQGLNAYASYSWFSYYGYYTGWGWYAPGFSTAWGINYPWYTTVGVTAYDLGTLFVTIIPTASVNPATRQISAAWVGAASALLNEFVTSSTVVNAIDEMFAQSPYLVAP